MAAVGEPFDGTAGFGLGGGKNIDEFGLADAAGAGAAHDEAAGLEAAEGFAIEFGVGADGFGRVGFLFGEGGRIADDDVVGLFGDGGPFRGDVELKRLARGAIGFDIFFGEPQCVGGSIDEIGVKFEVSVFCLLGELRGPLADVTAEIEHACGSAGAVEIEKKANVPLLIEKKSGFLAG